MVGLERQTTKPLMSSHILVFVLTKSNKWMWTLQINIYWWKASLVAWVCINWSVFICCSRCDLVLKRWWSIFYFTLMLVAEQKQPACCSNLLELNSHMKDITTRHGPKSKPVSSLICFYPIWSQNRKHLYMYVKIIWTIISAIVNTCLMQGQS